MTERGAAEEPRDRAQLLARAFAALLGEVILWDCAARVVFASAGALRRLGLAPPHPSPSPAGAGADASLVGRACHELPLEPILRTALHEGVAAALSTGKPLARDLSEHLSFRSLPLIDPDGAVWAAVTWLRPVVSSSLSAAGEAGEAGEDGEPIVWEDGDALIEGFRARYELADISSSLYDAQGRFQAVNVVAAESMGVDPAAVIGRSFDEVFTAEVAAEYHRRTRIVLRTRWPLVCEDHVVTAQREAWYMSVLVPLHNPRGRIIGVHAMSHDLTALRREAARARLDAVIVEVSRGLVGLDPAAIDGAVDEALREVAAVLGADAIALLQPLPDAALLTATHRWGGDPEETLTLAPGPVQALAAVTREPVIVVQDVGLVAVPEALQGVIGGAPRSLVFVPVQAEATLLGGLLLRWYTAPTHGSQQVLTPLPVLADLLLAVLRRKRAEEALQRSEASLRRAQALAHVGSYSFDLRTNTAQFSEESRRMLGYTLANRPPGLAESIQRHIHPEDRALLIAQVERIIAEGGMLERELRVLRADGAVRDVQIVTEAQRDGSGVVTMLHGTVLDVSERRRLEAQLLHAQKMEAIGRLAGGVAHDFNNLLTVILGGTAALQAELRAGPHADLVAEIDDAGRRATALTRQLLAFSRRQVLTPVELDLGQVVRDSLRVLARVIGEDIELELALANEALPVVADASQVEQVLLNLVVNAREAMPAGGRLTIRTTLLQRPTPVVGEAEPWTMLAVRDTGCGLAPEVQARMFEPFFTTKPRGQGSGLGLSTVHAVVDGLGGAVEVDSVLGVGTELRVFLPSRRAPALTARTRPPAAGDLRGHETVLVVEDEAGVRNLVKRVLDEKGYRVLTAREAGEALRICSEVAVDLVLTDVVMPGLGGHALAQRLQERQPIRVLFMSGYDPESPALAAGGLLRKPFAPQELATRVREALDSPVPEVMSGGTATGASGSG